MVVKKSFILRSPLKKKMFSKAQQPQQMPSAKATTSFFKPEPTFKSLATEQQAVAERAPESVMRLPIAPSTSARFETSPTFNTPSNFKRQTSNLPIQAKLTVGQSNDKYEQEADAMADKVVQRWAIPNVTRPSGRDSQQIPTITPFNINAAQRACAACEKEDKDHIQRKESGEMTASPSVESRLSATKGGGSSLPESTRTHMESAIGADFSNVRVHTGDTVVQLSQDLSAHAFTHGSDVYFNSGKYAPDTEGGRHLLAHELTHTVQQGGSSVSLNRIQRFGSDEHRRIGDNNVSSNALITGVGTISFGEMIALGDYFESVSEMTTLANSGLTGVNQIKHALSKVNPARPPVASAENAVMTRYYDLAGRNQTHFTTGSSAGNSNRERYIAGHIAAINAAFLQGSNPSVLNGANWVAEEAFAQHFLTDAFSAGHVRTPRGDIQAHWSRLLPNFIPNFVTMVSCYMASHINARDNVGYVLTVDSLTNRIRPKIVAQAGNKLGAFSIGDLISKVLHDADNEGLDVVSQSSSTSSGTHRWRSLGDGNLFAASGVGNTAQQQTQQMINAAVRFSFDEAQQAFRAGASNNVNAKNTLLLPSNFDALPLLPLVDSTSTTNTHFAWAASSIDMLPNNIKTLIIAAFDPGTEIRNGLDSMPVPCLTQESGFDLHTGDAFLCFKRKLLSDIWLTITQIAHGGTNLCPPNKNDFCPTLRGSCATTAPSGSGGSGNNPSVPAPANNGQTGALDSGVSPSISDASTFLPGGLGH
jgi:Domain of unknown function (DUF4157)